MGAIETVTVGDHRVVLADSITTVDSVAAGCIVITASHGGRSAAKYAVRVPALLHVFNDAGVGKDGAGIAGLSDLEAAGIAACTVSHMTARIGEAHDTLDNGIISHVNGAAGKLGLKAGQRLRAAIEELREVKSGA